MKLSHLALAAAVAGLMAGTQSAAFAGDEGCKTATGACCAKDKKDDKASCKGAAGCGAKKDDKASCKGAAGCGAKKDDKHACKAAEPAK